MCYLGVDKSGTPRLYQFPRLFLRPPGVFLTYNPSHSGDNRLSPEKVEITGYLQIKVEITRLSPEWCNNMNLKENFIRIIGILPNYLSVYKHCICFGYNEFIGF